MSDDLATVFTRPPVAQSGAGPCPEAGAIADAARSAGDPAGNCALAEHAAACPACAAAWSVAREIAVLEARATGVARLARPARRRSRPMWFAAAAALLALAVIVPITLRDRGSPPLTRSAKGPVIAPLVDLDAPLPARRFRLRWAGAPAGSRYEVRVFDARLERIAGARGLAEPEYIVPQDALAKVPPGGDVLWQVVATLPDGRSVVSDTFVARRE